MAKWSLAMRVLPLALVVVGVKFAVAELGWEIIEASPLLGSIVTANVFLLGFLLAGTLTDYKESERLPGEVASHIESIADECWILGTSKGEPPARACMESLRTLAGRTVGWFREEVGTDELLREVAALDRHFLDFEPHVEITFISRLKGEQAAVRSKIVRMDTIRRTGFVAAAYAIAELGIALLLIGLLVTDLGSAGEAFFTGIIAFFLCYVLALIKDLDDPYEHGAHAGGIFRARGGDEVSYASLEAAQVRIGGLLEQI